jgi:Xaa-Pro aminopeptidase
MKQDLDALMQAADLEGLLITGPAAHNPPMRYFTGNVHIGAGDLIKKRGVAPILFCNPMEREEAARTGLQTKNLAAYNLNDLIQQAGGDRAKGAALRYQAMLADCGLASGRIALYGHVNLGPAFAIFNALAELMPGIELVGETGEGVIATAMETKDETEVGRIRRMGVITAEVVGRTRAFLQSHKAKDGLLVKTDGNPLTIADVKARINVWANELGVENPHGTIFAIGRDAGVPHSVGAPDDVLELGRTIVFDIFLQEPGGGYHYDFTRTWCLGHAPQAEQALYDQVKTVFDDLMDGIEANAPLKGLQDRTCELFEGMGHETIRHNPLIEEGYVHGISHGLGINIHELPSYHNKDASLRPGVVVTIEPGLYYPSKGMGVRIEDTVYVHPHGEIEILADFPHDLVIPIETI